MAPTLARLVHRTQHKRARADRSRDAKNVLRRSTPGCYDAGAAASRKHVCISPLDVEHAQSCLAGLKI